MTVIPAYEASHVRQDLFILRNIPLPLPQPTLASAFFVVHVSPDYLFALLTTHPHYLSMVVRNPLRNACVDLSYEK